MQTEQYLIITPNSRSQFRVSSITFSSVTQSLSLSRQIDLVTSTRTPITSQVNQPLFPTLSPTARRDHPGLCQLTIIAIDLTIYRSALGHQAINRIALGQAISQQLPVNIQKMGKVSSVVKREKGGIEWIGEKSELDYGMWERLKGEKWEVDFQDYVDSKWKRVFSELRATSIKELSFHRLNVPRLVDSICHISFHQLQTLELNHLNIVSCQAFPKLQLPLLERLELNYTSIISIRPLRKMHVPNLKHLSILESRCVEGGWFSELNCNYEFGELIMFSPKKKGIPENYEWVFKGKPTSLQLFEYYNTRVIRSPSRRTMLVQKYPSAKITLRYDSIH